MYRFEHTKTTRYNDYIYRYAFIYQFGMPGRVNYAAGQDRKKGDYKN